MQKSLVSVPNIKTEILPTKFRTRKRGTKSRMQFFNSVCATKAIKNWELFNREKETSQDMKHLHIIDAWKMLKMKVN